jgi:4-carboxymuconolactone decarboxylase
LVILTAALAHGCAFEWDSHLPLARAAGVREEVLDHLLDGGGSLTDSEALFIDFVRELCAGSTVSSETFERAKVLLGESGIVELCATVGYYTMLAMVMGACDAC